MGGRESVGIVRCQGYRIAFLALLSAAAAAGCSGTTVPSDLPVTGDQDVRWTTTVGPWLLQDLWSDAERYGAGHGLMIPLYAAFYAHQVGWQQEFANQFLRLTIADPTPAKGAELSWLQYLYLASRFLVLSQRSDHGALIPEGLPELLLRTTHDLWSNRPAWQWDRADFPGGMQERLLWKLAANSQERSYYRAIVDDEMFLFAIAADLRQYEHLTGQRSAYSEELSVILGLARSVYQQRVVPQTNGGWLFQPGVWEDHPDDQFAGHREKTPDMRPLVRHGVAEDASHSHRLPLWLISLRDANLPSSRDYRYYDALLKGLERQFFSRVLRNPSSDFAGFRTTNYMDGWNGVYGSDVTRGRTYGPYELSGTITYGWWAFLGSPRSNALYRNLAATFPLDPAVVRLYTGPDTIGPPHPVLGKPVGFYNGYRQLVVKLAASLQLER